VKGLELKGNMGKNIKNHGIMSNNMFVCTKWIQDCEASCGVGIEILLNNCARQDDEKARTVAIMGYQNCPRTLNTFDYAVSTHIESSSSYKWSQMLDLLAYLFDRPCTFADD
jgi:hypothetical protein